MKRYTLVRDLRQPAVNELEFEAFAHRDVWPRKLGDFTAPALCELAGKREWGAGEHNRKAGALEADAKQLRALAYEMDPDAGADGKPPINGD